VTRFCPCFMSSSSLFHVCVFMCSLMCSLIVLYGGKFLFIAPVTDLRSVVAMVFTHDPVGCVTVDSLETLHPGKYTVTPRYLVEKLCRGSSCSGL